MQTPEIMSQDSSGELGLIRASVRKLLRERKIAALATAETGTNHPYASLITVATDTDASPIFLISRLAWHTRNLETDPRASILFAAQAGSGDPLNFARVSVLGRAERTSEPRLRSRFLASHPEAAFYADFADFSFWRLAVEQAHYVGGFGRISTLSAAELLVDTGFARDWDTQIEAVIGSVNATQPDLVRSLGGGGNEAWRIAACDPDGCDLVSDEATKRLNFPTPLSSPETLSAVLSAFSHECAISGIN